MPKLTLEIVVDEMLTVDKVRRMRLCSPMNNDDGDV
jgi:hypothetical protein